MLSVNNDLFIPTLSHPIGKTLVSPSSAGMKVYLIILNASCKCFQCPGSLNEFFFCTCNDIKVKTHIKKFFIFLVKLSIKSFASSRLVFKSYGIYGFRLRPAFFVYCILLLSILVILLLINCIAFPGSVGSIWILIFIFKLQSNNSAIRLSVNDVGRSLKTLSCCIMVQSL